MNQENEIEVLGFWWILGHSEEKWAGQLKYSAENGVILQIFQDGVHKEFDGWNQRFDIIYGIGDGEVYTLYNSIQIASSSNNVEYYTFKASLLCIHNSHYLENKEDMKFISLGAKMNITNDFFSSLKSYNYTSPRIDSKRQHVIEESHQNIDFIVSDTLTGNIYVGGSRSWKRYSFEISKGIWFWIKSKDNSLVSIDIFLEKMNYLRIFFSIIIHGICTYDKMEVARPDFEGFMKLYQKNRFGSKHKDKMIFEYEDVGNKLSSIIEYWFRICQEIPEVIKLFYHTYTQFYEYHFRDTYVAIEGIFQWKKNCDTKDKNVISILLNDILISKEKRDNIPTFVKIVDGFPKWSEVARDNRHYHTHLNKNKYADKIVDDKELLKLMRKMQAIILFYILEALGLSDSEIESAFRRMELYFLPSFF